MKVEPEVIESEEVSETESPPPPPPKKSKKVKVKVEPEVIESEEVSETQSPPPPKKSKKVKVKVEPEVIESEEVSETQSPPPPKKSKKPTLEAKVSQAVVTNSTRTKKRKADPVNDENKCVPSKVANVGGNGALVVGQSKGVKKNIREIKQTVKPVLVSKQLVGSDDEELEADEEEFQKSQTKSVVKVVSSKSKVKVEPDPQQKTNTKTKRSKNKTELQKQREQSRSEWFDPQKYDTTRIKHPPVVKKVLPEGAEIFCGKCNEVFDEVSQLTAHEKTCYVGRRYKCPESGCDHYNSQKSLLHQHIKAVHYNDPFVCDTCGDTFVYKKSLDKHLKRVHKLGPQTYKYVCPDCGKGTDDKTEYGVHLARHENLKRYKCNICSQAFYSQSQLTTHIKHSCVSTTTTTKSFECSVCGQQSKTEDRYREHFRSAHILNEDPRPFFCEDCISRYFSESSFSRHQGKCTGIV